MGETQPTAPVGRPSKYQPDFAAQAYKLCLLGATDLEMAGFFEVCVATVQNWKIDFPEFLDAIRDGKIKADAHLAHKLFNRAEGAEWEEEQAIKVKTGQYTEVVEIVKLKRSAPPDTTALIMWLKNRQPDKWRDTQSLQQLDKNGNPADMPLRVIVELVGDPAPPRVEQSAPQTGHRLSDAVRKSVDFIG